MQSKPVRLIVGLGNPGDDYRHHRHNLGFRVVEEVARRLEVVFQPGDSSYLVATEQGPAGTTVLLKPLTFMNLSGQAVVAWSRDTGVPVTGSPPVTVGEPELAASSAPAGPSPEGEASGVRPLVVCDDLSLPLGAVRLRPAGSSGGQNGLASLIDHLRGEEFPRLRLGIAPLEGEIDPAAWSEHVLADFGENERETAAEMVSHAASALEFWLQHGLEPTISRFNRRVGPDPGRSG